MPAFASSHILAKTPKEGKWREKVAAFKAGKEIGGFFQIRT